MTQKIKLGTRLSALAMWQANAVKHMLEVGGFEVEIVKIETKGDKILDRTLAKIGSKGVFTEELEVQLLAGTIDIVQHSAKDLQSDLGDDLEIIAFTEREIANDVLISLNPENTFLNKKEFVIGTSSTRRVAMIKNLYPHLKTVEMRGNLQTRMRKLEEGQADALLLAYAGVQRVGYAHQITSIIPLTDFVPAVGQGSIAIECAKNLPESIKEKIKSLCNHASTELCILAEREYLRTLQGGCSIPVFANAIILENGMVEINGGIVSLNGDQIIKNTMIGNDPIVLGSALGQNILQQGGKEILAEIRNQL